MYGIVLRAGVFFACLFSASAASLSSWKCPDPKCCLPSPGPSSCHALEEPCITSCTHTCPDGKQRTCASRGQWMVFCELGVALQEEIPCYILSDCEGFLNRYDPCLDIGCTDPEALRDLCNETPFEE